MRWTEAASYLMKDRTQAYRLLRVVLSVLILTSFVCLHGYAREDSLQNVAEEKGLADSPGYGKGISIVDVNSDGWDDIWDTNTTSPKDRPSRSTFYLNQRDGTFRIVDLGVERHDVWCAWGAAWADFDNDDDPDVLLINGGFLGEGSLALYENRWVDGKQLRRISHVSGITAEEHAWWGASWADFNNDGCLDFVAVDRVGRPWLYRNDCDKTFTEVAQELGIDIQFEDGKNPVWLDFDNDGDQDLYLGGIKHHRLYRNAGDRGFVDVTQALGTELMAAPGVFAAFSSDFNHDGNMDLYLGRRSAQDLIAFGQPDGRFQVHGKDIGIVTKNSPDLSENTMGLGAGDINADGYVDILIGTGNPADALYDIVFCGGKEPGNPSGVAFHRCGGFARRGHGKERTHGIAIGDLDHDGSNDVLYNLGGSPVFDYLQGKESDSRSFNALYSSTESNKNTATILLKGVDSNRDAIGARFTVMISRDEKFHYSVRSLEAFQSQNSRWQLLSLMNKKRANVEVRWPSGQKTTHEVRAGDRKIIHERPE